MGKNITLKIISMSRGVTTFLDSPYCNTYVPSEVKEWILQSNTGTTIIIRTSNEIVSEIDSLFKEDVRIDYEPL